MVKLELGAGMWGRKQAETRGRDRQQQPRDDAAAAWQASQLGQGGQALHSTISIKLNNH